MGGQTGSKLLSLGMMTESEMAEYRSAAYQAGMDYREIKEKQLIPGNEVKVADGYTGFVLEVGTPEQMATFWEIRKRQDKAAGRENETEICSVTNNKERNK